MQGRPPGTVHANRTAAQGSVPEIQANGRHSPHALPAMIDASSDQMNGLRLVRDAQAPARIDAGPSRVLPSLAAPHLVPCFLLSLRRLRFDAITAGGRCLTGHFQTCPIALCRLYNLGRLCGRGGIIGLCVHANCAGISICDELSSKRWSRGCCLRWWT